MSEENLPASGGEKDPLQEKWLVEEHPFVSNAPLLGPLIARLRSAWNNVAARWYVRAILAQQNEFNHLAAQRLAALQTQFTALDREHGETRHDSAEIITQLRQMNRHLQNMEQRLMRLEAALEHREAADS